MIVLACGDRDWIDIDTIRRGLSQFDRRSTLLEGGALGADIIAAGVWLDMGGYCVINEPADWRRFKRAAGPMRNARMLTYRPDRVIAFHDDLATSTGTADMVRRARRQGIPVEQWTTYGTIVAM